MSYCGYLAALFLAGYAIILWVYYPDCAPDHIAVVAPQTASQWACVRGYSPQWSPTNKATVHAD